MTKKKLIQTDWPIFDDWIEDIEDDGDAAFWDEFLYRDNQVEAQEESGTITFMDSKGRLQTIAGQVHHHQSVLKLD